MAIVRKKMVNDELNTVKTQIDSITQTAIGFPNYSAATKINSQPRNVTYTAPSDGWLYIHVYCAISNANFGNFKVTVGNMTFQALTGYASNGAKSSNVILPLPKGTTVTCTNWCEGGTLWFIPCK